MINSTFLSVKNSETLSDGATSSAEGYARLDEDGEGALFVKFSRSPESPYWIVGTDYENYSVVWSCKDITERDSYRKLLGVDEVCGLNISCRTVLGAVQKAGAVDERKRGGRWGSSREQFECRSVRTNGTRWERVRQKSIVFVKSFLFNKSLHLSSECTKTAAVIYSFQCLLEVTQKIMTH